MKLRIGFRFFADEIQKIPLRHQRDEFTVCWQMRKISSRDYEIVYASANLRQFLMWTAQELVDNSKLVHQFQCGWMNRISAKIAQKIRMLFKHQHLDSPAGEQKAQYHPGRTTACNATADRDSFRRGILLRHRIPLTKLQLREDIQAKILGCLNRAAGSHVSAGNHGFCSSSNRLERILKSPG